MSSNEPTRWGETAEIGGTPERLGGRYELGAVLGQGGMATVRRGTDVRLGRTVAIKTLRADLVDAPGFQSRFRREARAVAGLGHPAIVRVYDAGEDTIGGVATLYIVMEYVDGRTLRDLLQEGGRLARDRVLEITAEILSALESSHRRGIVHRDVKPANVMVTPAGAVKVMDFGIARAVADQSGTMTQTSTVIGTAHYLSPEQARGESADARGDVYSAGCLLYELLTGRPPFHGDSAVAVLYQHVREEPRPPSAIDTEIPPEVDAIVRTAMAKRPSDRYQSAADMRRDLLRVLSGDPLAVAMAVEDTGELGTPDDAATEVVAAVPGTRNEAAGPVERGGSARRRRLYAIASFAVLLVAGVVGIALLSGDGGNRAADPDRIPPAAPAGSPTPSADRTEPTPPDNESTADTAERAGVEEERTDEPTADAEPTEDADDTSGDGNEPGNDGETEPTDDASPTDSPTPTDPPSTTESPTTAEPTSPDPESTDTSTPTPTEETTTTPPDSDESTEEADDA